MRMAPSSRRNSVLASRSIRYRLQQQRRRLLGYVAAVVFSSAALLLYVWQWVHAQELMRQIASHEKRVAVLSKEAQLEATKETLIGFDRLTANAAQQFNLGFYTKRNLVVPPSLRHLVEEDQRQSGGQ